MKTWQLLTAESIFLDIDVKDKMALLRFAAEEFVHRGIAKDSKSLYDGMRIREEVLSTGIGSGIAIPHTTCMEASTAAILLIRLGRPIDFNALDALPVDIVLALVVPADEATLHLQILAGISRLCRNSLFLKAVRTADSPKTLLEKIKALEE